MTEVTTRPVVMGRRGAVCTEHPLATRVGIDVLRAGGNAFDAAVAAAAALAVVEPEMNGVGGDGFYLLFEAERGRSITVHAAAPTAAAATLERYGDRIPMHGPLAAMPPGAVAGWVHIAERYGTRPLKELLKPAVAYAREGYPATRHFCRAVDVLESAIRRDPGCASVFLKDGQLPRLGSTIRNPALARTLEAIAVGGSDVLFGGEVGRQLAQFAQANGGIITIDDLARHQAEERDPLKSSYRDLAVQVSDRPTMGFALLIELGILERFPVGDLPRLSPDHVHLLVEAKKLAFIEREEHGGDPRFLTTPFEPALSRDHARELAAKIDSKRATPRPPTDDRDGDTTYFCIVDAQGNAVSGIQSLAAPFGSCAMDPATGILLNNRMTWFRLDPQHPNALGPGKWVRNTINTPMAIQGGNVRCVFGTPGGDSQVQVSMQVLSAMVDHGLDPQQAVEMARWTHFQPGTSSYAVGFDGATLLMESRFPSETREELDRRGHRVMTIGPYESQTAASVIWRDDSGLLLCGSDPRRDNWAAAF